MGITILPPSLSWRKRDCGTWSGAAVTMMASKGAYSSQPK